MAKQTKTIYFSDSLDPIINLSIEEYLMSICNVDEVIMFLWQNCHTVVIGRHQNPYKECQMSKLKEDQVNLVRRISGGGAVYHDLGNLNFTFIAHEHNYNVEKQLNVILKSIQALGIEGRFAGRNDLTVQDKKFSGNAFMNEGDVYCHHGTLLVDAELDKLALYLTPSKMKVNSKGIDSVRSRVSNLKEYNPNITVDILKDTLVRTFMYGYEGECETVRFDTRSKDLFESYIKKYRTWAWNVGESPKCDINHLGKFIWGTFEISMDIECGTISNCFINTDALAIEPFEKLSEALINQVATHANFKASIDRIIANTEIAEDLIKLFGEHY